MDVNKKTSLSAGAVIRAILIEDPEVSSRVNKIYPIFTDSAELPYIVYRRAEMEVSPQKAGQPGADTIQMEITCYTERYGEGIELAEAVRAALDMVAATHEGQRMRGCYLSNSEEAWENDAYIQQLTFTIKI